MEVKIQSLSQKWLNILNKWKLVESQQEINSILQLITLEKFISGGVDNTEFLEMEAQKIAILQSQMNIFNTLKKKRRLQSQK